MYGYKNRQADGVILLLPFKKVALVRRRVSAGVAHLAMGLSRWQWWRWRRRFWYRLHALYIALSHSPVTRYPCSVRRVMELPW